MVLGVERVTRATPSAQPPETDAPGARGGHPPRAPGAVSFARGTTLAPTGARSCPALTLLLAARAPALAPRARSARGRLARAGLGRRGRFDGRADLGAVLLLHPRALGQ